MRIIKILLIGIAAVSVGVAQTINISGKVTDTGTTPISGAIVRLEKNGLIDTTGADGSFTLSGAITVGTNGQIKQPSLPNKLSATIQNRLLWVTVAKKLAIAAITYNLHGQVLSTMQKTMDAGTHSLLLPCDGAGVYLYRIKTGKNEIMIRSPSIDGKYQGTATSIQRSTFSATLAKQALKTFAINDVIAVTKDRFLNYRVIATNSDTSGIKIKMILCEEPLIDIDENVYQTVRIGNQVWMTENLRTTRYNDNIPIPLGTSTATWNNDTTPKYCYYNNTTNPDSIKKFGVLYNWYVVNPANPHKIAPKGWHMPSDSEWTVLEKYLVFNGYNWDRTTDTSQENKIAKSLAAKTDWNTYTTTGIIGCELTKNNSSGFSALPGGYREVDGWFDAQSISGYWWSASKYVASLAWYRYLYFGDSSLYRFSHSESCGFSVRLVRD